MQSEDDEKTFVPRQPSDTARADRPLLGEIYKSSRPWKIRSNTDASSDATSTEDEKKKPSTTAASKSDDIVLKYLSFEEPTAANEEDNEERFLPVQTPIDITSYFASDTPSNTTTDDRIPIFEPISAQVEVQQDESIPDFPTEHGIVTEDTGTPDIPEEHDDGDETDAEMSDNEKERLKAKGITFYYFFVLRTGN